MKVRLVLSAVALGTLGTFAAAASAAPSACVHLSVSVNGTTQTVDQCVPPAAAAR